MFYKYTPVITERTARELATTARAQLLKTLIVNRREISEINQLRPNQDTNEFLTVFECHIKRINVCEIPTDQLRNCISAFQNKNRNSDISALLNICQSAIDAEVEKGKIRNLHQSQNQRKKIINHAMLIATGPTIAIIVGLILMPFYPAGFIIASLALAALVIGEMIFWIRNYRNYQQLSIKIDTMDLVVDYGNEVAIPPKRSQTKASAIAPNPVSRLSENKPKTKHTTQPYFLSPETNAELNKLINNASQVSNQFFGNLVEIISSSSQRFNQDSPSDLKRS